MSVEIAAIASESSVADQKKVSVNLLALLRAIFKDSQYVDVEEGIQAYVLPRTDAHQSEYITDEDNRVEFISGFTGSKAYTVITETEALLWTDGRYFAQAETQLGEGWTLMKFVPGEIKPVDWILQNLPIGSSVGFDPSLFSFSEGKQFVESLESFGIAPISIAKQNLVDIIWENRSVEQLKKTICLSSSECGEESTSKIERVRKQMLQNKCDTLVLTLLDDVAWLLNIRGFDIPFNPLVFSVVIVNLTEVFLFIDEQKLSPEVKLHLSHVRIFPYKAAAKFLLKYHNRLKEECAKTHKIWLPSSVNYSLGSLIDQKFTFVTSSPIQLMKSIKNDIEIMGMHNSSIRDSAAIVQFLLWINRELDLGHFVDEERASKQIFYYRSQQPNFVSLSFETCSAVGKNAALPHYKHTPETNTKLLCSQDPYSACYLVDSGGHYRDGTTDVTRTIYYGIEPDSYFMKMFTLVLKGHIDCAMLRFPDGTNAIRLDSLARISLWQDGYDFGHAVGHGVGHYLNVHESPYIGHARYHEDTGTIKKGMIVTIEPGYYELNKFGIRIENCYEVVQVNPKSLSSGATNYLTFSPITFVPIQKNLIVKNLLDEKHINWINNYHNRCLEVVGKYLQERSLQEEYNFLAQNCTPL